LTGFTGQEDIYTVDELLSIAICSLFSISYWLTELVSLISTSEQLTTAHRFTRPASLTHAMHLLSTFVPQFRNAAHSRRSMASTTESPFISRRQYLKLAPRHFAHYISFFAWLSLNR
jgi:hypothetical protein